MNDFFCKARVNECEWSIFFCVLQKLCAKANVISGCTSWLFGDRVLSTMEKCTWLVPEPFLWLLWKKEKKFAFGSWIILEMELYFNVFIILLLNGSWSDGSPYVSSLLPFVCVYPLWFDFGCTVARLHSLLGFTVSHQFLGVTLVSRFRLSSRKGQMPKSFGTETPLSRPYSTWNGRVYGRAVLWNCWKRSDGTSTTTKTTSVTDDGRTGTKPWECIRPLVIITYSMRVLI